MKLKQQKLRLNVCLERDIVEALDLLRRSKNFRSTRSALIEALIKDSLDRLFRHNNGVIGD